jgi:4-hydroxybenzoate polyprenyltransferase
MASVKNYLSLIKFSHTVFAMPFAIIGYLVAMLKNEHLLAFHDTPYKTIGAFKFDNGSMRHLQVKLLLIIACMVLARSAAMAFNRYLDRFFDAQNPRTAVREIPSGLIKGKNALWFTIICSLLFVTVCWFINKTCFYLSFVALAVVLGYSYTKRFTALCHLVLGAGLALAPIGAFLAITGKFEWLPLLFSFAVFTWVSGFDIIYALQDDAFDRQHQLHSLPVALGRKKALRVSEMLHVLSAGFILYAGWYGYFGTWYFVGAAFFCALLLYQHLLVKPGNLSKVNMAFFTTNGIASVVFLVFVIADLYTHY